MTEYEAVIGLEIHAQLKTKTKLFCSCSSAFGAQPNSHICPICMGLPGVLPVINRKTVELAVKVALSVASKVHSESFFARKSYFYPDLPKNYQISQFERPLATGGQIEIRTDGGTRKINLVRLHMEEDAGKLVHQGAAAIAGSNESFVDLNRTGTPLLEIVSEPEIKTPEEAKEYVSTLRQILVYLDACDGNMEEGSLRCDANVSIRPVGETKLGIKTEVKNMNSLRALVRAMTYEIARQKEVLSGGGRIVQETRHWDEPAGKTISLRNKEESHDYRYFPEPDLPPLQVDAQWQEEIKKTIPELPGQRRERYIAQLGLSEYDSDIILADKDMADFFEACLKIYPTAKTLINWLMSDISAYINGQKTSIKDTKLTPQHLAELLTLVDQKTIGGKIAKDVLSKIWETGAKPSDIIEKQNLKQMFSDSEIRPIVAKVIAENPAAITDYRAGKEGAIKFLVGQVMKLSRGQADPQAAMELLKKNIG